MTTEAERMLMLERNLSDQAKSITEVITDQREIRGDVSDLKRANDIRDVEDRHLDERLDRIEEQIKAVYGLGKWLLGAIGSVVVVAVVGFMLKGGLLGKPARFVFAAAAGFCAAIIFACTLYFVFMVGPAVETRFFPVVSKLTVTSLAADETGQAVIGAQFTKLRDCEYLGIAWYRGSPSGQFERVPVILQRQEGDTSSPNRPTGTQRAGPWIIGMPPAEIPGNSFARLSHRCHPFWVTTTDFYP